MSRRALVRLDGGRVVLVDERPMDEGEQKALVDQLRSFGPGTSSIGVLDDCELVDWREPAYIEIPNSLTPRPGEIIHPGMPDG